MTVTLSGHFTGVATDSTITGGTDAWDWQLADSGTSFTGLLTACSISDCPNGFRYQGTISGSVTGSSVTFTVRVPENGVGGSPTCTMTLSGAGTVAQRGGAAPSVAVDGTYSGTSSCGGAITSGTFFVTRAA